MSAHHVNGKSCALCSEKIATLDPVMQPFATWVKAQFEDCHFSWCFRDQANQELFFQMGKTRCHFPNSAHNVESEGKPAALAFDIFQLRADGVAYFHASYCALVWAKLGPFAQGAVEWSGVWRGFKEQDHFQHVKYKGLKSC